MNKKLLKNLKLIKGNQIIQASILINGEFIEDIIPIRQKVNDQNIEAIDLSGLVALSGLIDSHTHFKLKIGINKYNSDDFESGSLACIKGGITTYIDFTDGDLKDSKKDWFNRKKDVLCSYADYTFHSVVKNLLTSDDVKFKFKKLKALGVSSIKIFTTYKNRGMMTSDDVICSLLKNAAENDIVVCVHAESEDIINYNLERYKKHYKEIKYHSVIRDEFSEYYAISKLLKLNEYFNAKIYFVHTTSPASVDVINEYKKKGYNVYAELCPQYFVFSNEIYSDRNAYLFTFTPPLRSENSRIKILKNISAFDTIATDSCAFFKKDKKKFRNDATKIPMGIASSELLLPLVYTYAVKSSHMSLYDLQQKLSTNPAKIFSIPKKGEIKKGYYADLCIFDPNESFAVKSSELSHRCDYSVYEGLKLYGKVKKTFLRGTQVYDGNHQVYSHPGKMV